MRNPGLMRVASRLYKDAVTIDEYNDRGKFQQEIIAEFTKSRDAGGGNQWKSCWCC